MTETPNTIAVHVEMAAGYVPGVRLAAALAELHDALQEEGSEVAGFSLGRTDSIECFSLVQKIDPKWQAGQPLSWYLSLCTNEN
jgi:hypothetical protein